MNLGFAASSVFGAAIGGALIAAFGVSAALLVDAASFLVIAVLLGTSAPAARDRAHTTTSPGTSASATGFASRARTRSCARC